MAASSTLMAAPEAPVAEPESAKGGKKKLILAVVAVLVVAAAGYFFLKPTAAPAEPVAAPEPVPGEVVEVGQMMVNLADPGRYARVSFSVVLVEGAALEPVEAKFPLLKEAVLFELSKVTADHLRAPDGLDAMAETLSERARGLYEDGSVLRVVLTELLVQ